MSSIPPFEIKDRRVDKTGQALMNTASVALLLKLASGAGKWTPWKTMRNFVAACHITELDMQPLVTAGWVETRIGRTDALAVRITDSGNAMVRGLVDWLKFAAEAEAGKEVAA